MFGWGDMPRERRVRIWSVSLFGEFYLVPWRMQGHRGKYALISKPKFADYIFYLSLIINQNECICDSLKFAISSKKKSRL